jgi:hypothetical protein
MIHKTAACPHKPLFKSKTSLSKTYRVCRRHYPQSTVGLRKVKHLPQGIIPRNGDFWIYSKSILVSARWGVSLRPRQPPSPQTPHPPHPHNKVTHLIGGKGASNGAPARCTWPPIGRNYWKALVVEKSPLRNKWLLSTPRLREAFLPLRKCCLIAPIIARPPMSSN